MLEPRTLVKCVLCLANCAGTLHCNVCDVGLTVLDFCTLVSILWTELHWTVHAGTSACYEVDKVKVYRNSEMLPFLIYKIFISFRLFCFLFLFGVGGVLYFWGFFRRGWWILRKNHNLSQKVVILNTKGLFLGKFILENYAEVIFKKT